MSQILDSAYKFKRELIDLDDAALQTLEKAYVSTYRSLEEQLRRTLESEINESKGQTVTGRIFKTRRYRELLAQTESELDKLGVDTASLITRQQRDALGMGMVQAEALTSQSAAAAISWNSINVDAYKNMIGFLADGSPLSYKFAGMADDVKTGIKNTITNGIAQGWNPRKTASAITQKYGVDSLTNALTVCRTETMRAYRTSTMDSYRANSDIISDWQWLASMSKLTCAACWGMNGTVHPLTEDFNDHVRGRCTSIPVIKGRGPEKMNSEVAFRKIPEDEQKFILGPGRHELWKKGEICLAEVPVKVKNETWGDTFQLRTVRELQSPEYKAALKKNVEKMSADWTDKSWGAPSIQTKEAISRYLNVSGMVHNPDNHLVDNALVEGKREIVNSVYWKTQKDFADKGITEVRLYRGLKNLHEDINVAESWTTDYNKTVKYAEESGIMLEKNIPVSRIFMHHKSDGWINSRNENESEYIVLGEAPK